MGKRMSEGGLRSWGNGCKVEGMRKKEKGGWVKMRGLW